MKIAITGTRDVAPGGRELIKRALNEVIASRNDIEAIIFGGARGTDTVALECAYEIKREMQRNFELIVVVPFKIEKQPRAAQDAILKYATRVIELNLPFSMGGYHKRNEELVKMADLILAFWDRKDGGTSDTIERARKHGKEIKVIELSRHESR